MTTAWTMLAKQNGTQQDWAQVGWWETAGGNRKTFVQYTVFSSSFITHYYDPKPVNSLHVYETLYNNTPGKFTFKVSGVNVEDPIQLTWWPDQALIAGETQTLASQMPGGYNFYQYLWDSRIWFNGGWRLFNGIPIPYDFGNFGFDWNLSDDMYIWDRKCSR